MKKHELTDLDLIDQFKSSGNESAFDHLLRRYDSWIKKEAQRYFGYGYEPEDYYQIGSMSLLKAVLTYKQSGSSFYTYALKCIRNGLINEYRKIVSDVKEVSGEAVLPLMHETRSNYTPLNSDFAEEIRQSKLFKYRQTIRLALENAEILSEFEKKCLSKYIEGKSMPEIASELNTDIKEIDNGLVRCRKKLRALNVESGGTTVSKKKTYTPKTKVERQREVDELITLADEKIKSYHESPEAMLEMTEFMSSIHNYSYRNLELINKQFPGASAVGSFAFWKAKDFSVSEGEKGIKILVPTHIKSFVDAKGELKRLKEATPLELAQIKNGQLDVITKIYFSKGTVFDVSQTNAAQKDLPVIYPNKIWNFKLRDEDSLKQLQEGVSALTQHLNIEMSHTGIDEYKLGTSRGAYLQHIDGREKIVMNHRNSETQAVAVAIHELAHKKLHSKDELSKFSRTETSLGITSKEVKEFQAELISFVVCKNYGMDTADAAVGYIAKWTNNMRAIHADILPKVLEGVRSTVHEFIEVMDKSILQSRDLSLKQLQNQESLEDSKVKKQKSRSR